MGGRRQWRIVSLILYYHLKASDLTLQRAEVSRCQSGYWISYDNTIKRHQPQKQRIHHARAGFKSTLEESWCVCNFAPMQIGVTSSHTLFQPKDNQLESHALERFGLHDRLHNPRVWTVTASWHLTRWAMSHSHQRRREGEKHYFLHQECRLLSLPGAVGASRSAQPPRSWCTVD